MKCCHEMIPLELQFTRGQLGIHLEGAIVLTVAKSMSSAPLQASPTAAIHDGSIIFILCRTAICTTSTWSVMCSH